MITTADIARITGQPVAALYAVANNYRRGRIYQKTRSRTVYAPCNTLRNAQQDLLRVLARLLLPHTAATAFIIRGGPLINAERHVGATTLVQTDIRDFYPSISTGHIRSLLRSYFVDDAAATLIAALCTVDGQLATGALISPVIANAVCYQMDQEIDQWARCEGWVYTRYADDLTLSAKDKSVTQAQQQLSAAVATAGFVEAVHKRRVSHHPRSSLRVTGLVINPVPGLPAARLPRRYWHNLRARIHKLLNYDHDWRNWKEIEGLAAFGALVNPIKASPYVDAIHHWRLRKGVR